MKIELLVPVKDVFYKKETVLLEQGIYEVLFIHKSKDTNETFVRLKSESGQIKQITIDIYNQFAVRI